MSARPIFDSSSGEAPLNHGTTEFLDWSSLTQLSGSTSGSTRGFTRNRLIYRDKNALDSVNCFIVRGKLKREHTLEWFRGPWSITNMAKDFPSLIQTHLTFKRGIIPWNMNGPTSLHLLLDCPDFRVPCSNEKLNGTFTHDDRVGL